jgi:hypothetical protein
MKMFVECLIYEIWCLLVMLSIGLDDCIADAEDLILINPTSYTFPRMVINSIYASGQGDQLSLNGVSSSLPVV